MRLLLISLAMLIFGLPLGSQSEPEDVYSISLVQVALKLRMNEAKVITSVTQKNLARLGDGVSIALLKILDEQALTDPKTIQGFLSIIRDAFNQPQFSVVDIDKLPKVTLFLLSRLEREVVDSETRRDIQETIDFVKGKTA